MVFAVSTLNLLVKIFLDITFENARSSGFVEASSLQDVGCVDPIVMPPSHYMFLQIRTELELVHGYLRRDVRPISSRELQMSCVTRRGKADTLISNIVIKENSHRCRWHCICPGRRWYLRV